MAKKSRRRSRAGGLPCAARITRWRKVLAAQGEELTQRLSDRSVKIDITEEALAYILDEGYDPAYGARPVSAMHTSR